MIDGVRGVSALRELTALIQNLDKKAALPVTVEALQKIVDTQGGFKYFADIDGMRTEVFSAKELELGVKYWAEGIKKQNVFALENLVEQPQILQSAIFKNPALASALGFEKLVELIQNAENEAAALLQKDNAEGQSVKQSKSQKSQTEQTTTPAAEPKTAQKAGEGAANQNLSRTAAAETLLQKPTAEALKQSAFAEQKPSIKTQLPEGAKAQIEKAEALLQKTSPTPQGELLKIKEAIHKELAAAIIASAQKEAPKEAPNAVKEREKERQKDEAKEEQKEVKERPQKAPVKEETPKESVKERLVEYKRVLAAVLTKEEIEKIKADDAAKAKANPKTAEAQPQTAEAQSPLKTLKAELERLFFEKSEAFKAQTQAQIEEAIAQAMPALTSDGVKRLAEKIMEAIFGELPEFDADEAVLKALEQMQKRLEESLEAKKERASGEEGKTKEGEEGGGALMDAGGEEVFGDDGAKRESPVAKLKSAILEEAAKSVSKEEFQILSNIAVSINDDVYTFVLKDKGVLQFKKGGGERELMAKSVQFYSAFATLGPVSGEITHVDGYTSLSLNVEFESSYKFLKENLKELSFFDRKNISITHGIKEISQIKNSFLDAIG